MIGYLKGEFVYSDNDRIVLNVNGVGYDLLIKQRDIPNMKKGAEYQFYVQTFFKEQIGFELYGFDSLKEKRVFNQLVKVNKVGSKTALAVLDGNSPEDLISAIIDKQVDILSAVKGIGKKTSERIILELSDKFKKEFKGIVASNKVNKGDESALLDDLNSILLNLGYSTRQIRSVLDSLTKADVEGKDLEELIKVSLKRMRGI
jgi:Holliday junction DNA helicase RuvA